MRNYERVNGKLKPEDVEHIIQEVIADQRLEGLIMTDEEIDMLRKRINGDITKEEYMRWAIESVMS